ncbi:4Fe-4S single cluster domain-containing protein [Spirillospora sp. CA-253888]
MINVAETCTATRALGPGWRAAVWVQGCPFRCRGCIAPDWIPDRPARRVGPEELAAELLADPRVAGLTFSGGEPMEQAEGLAATVRAARRRRDVSLVCFTGHRLADLRGRPGPEALLAEVDVLIDGRYADPLNDGRGLRGSTNQQVHHLTGRLRGFPFEDGPRAAEIRLRRDEALLVGVPPKAMGEAWRRLGDDPGEETA